MATRRPAGHRGQWWQCGTHTLSGSTIKFHHVAVLAGDRHINISTSRWFLLRPPVNLISSVSHRLTSKPDVLTLSPASSAHAGKPPTAPCCKRWTSCAARRREKPAKVGTESRSARRFPGQFFACVWFVARWSKRIRLPCCRAFRGSDRIVGTVLPRKTNHSLACVQWGEQPHTRWNTYQNRVFLEFHYYFHVSSADDMMLTDNSSNCVPFILSKKLDLRWYVG